MFDVSPASVNMQNVVVDEYFPNIFNGRGVHADTLSRETYVNTQIVDVDSFLIDGFPISHW